MVGAILPFSTNDIDCRDTVAELEDGVFEWTRTFTARRATNARLTMDFAAAHKSSFSMIPAVNYNGNNWGTGHDPKGFEKDGEPWSYAYHRCAIAGATYSEGEEYSVALFGKLESPFSCSLIPQDDTAVHRLIWPEEERPLTYGGRDRYDPAFESILRLEAGEEFTATAYIVVEPVSLPRASYRKMLDFAWRMSYHVPKASFVPEKLWELGVRYAKESLWAEEGVFKGFSIGLTWPEDRWIQRPGGKYEAGWCGQNLSLANALLFDYLRTKDHSSLEKGIAALDTWADHARLDCGLLRVQFDPILTNWTGPERQDACNLGWAAGEFFEGHRLAGECGVDRPAYREIALGICDFAVEHQQADGRFGKAWTNDGECVDPNGTIGCFLIPPLVTAHQLTGDAKYLDAAVRAYDFYISDLARDGFSTAGALDTHCIDKESAIPLLTSALALYELTGRADYIKWAELTSYYLATWQWHYSTPYPEGTALRDLGYDTFGGTSVSTQHHHIDPYALSFVIPWLKLAEITGDDVWRERALAAWANGCIGVSDGSLVVMGKPRPAGSQDEGYLHTRWGNTFNVSQWLVAWPTAFRLGALRGLTDWSVLGAVGAVS